MHRFRFLFRRFVASTVTVVSAAASASLVVPSLSEVKQKEEKKKHFSVPYLLVGGGTANYYAALTIRARDPEARVLIVSEEKESPYNRPPLTKELWWYGDERTPSSLTYTALSGCRRDIRYESDGFYPVFNSFDNYKHGGIALIRNVKVVNVDAEKRCAELADGTCVEFQKCLIATGSKPKSLPELVNNTQLFKSVTILKDIDDYRQLLSILENSETKRVAIIGGDVLATELAYSLNRRFGQISTRLSAKKESASGRGCEPIHFYQLIPDSGVLARIFPKELSDYSTNQMRNLGVDVLTECKIKTADLLPAAKSGIKLGLKQKDSIEKEIEFDHVIVAVGSEPNVELAQRSHLELDEVLGGVKADSRMRVNDSVWVAGDICAFEDEALKMRRRLDYWENAQVTGRVAGENMTGGDKPYSHQAGFYMVFGIGDHVNAVGEVDATRYETLTYIFPPTETQKIEENDQLKAVVFYLTGDRRVVGVLFVNVYGMALEVARKIIGDAKPHNNDSEFNDLVKLFDVFYENNIDESATVAEEEEKPAKKNRK